MYENEDLTPEEQEELEELDGVLENDTEVGDEDLEGLGRRFRRYGNRAYSKFKKSARLYANRRVKKTMRNRYSTRGQAYLVNQHNKLSPNTREKLEKGQLQYGDGIYYIRKRIYGGGIIEFFEDSIDKKVGTTNISKGKLADYVNLVLERLEVGYGHSATSVTADKVAYDPITGSDPVALLNAELELVVDSKTLLKIPVNKINEPQKSVDGLANGYNLKSLKMIKESTDIQVRLHMPFDLVEDANNFHFVEITLRGAETKSR